MLFVFLQRKLICVLLDMVRQMSAEQYAAVTRALDAESAGRSNALVSDALALMLALLRRPVFRPHWADMLHLQHHVMLHALRSVPLQRAAEFKGGKTRFYLKIWDVS